PKERSAVAGNEGGVVEVLIVPLEEAPAARESIEVLEASAREFAEARGGVLIATFVTEESENTFPILPVREGEFVFVAFAGHSVANEKPSSTSLSNLAHAVDTAPDSIELLRLSPTSRSLLTGANRSR